MRNKLLLEYDIFNYTQIYNFDRQIKYNFYVNIKNIIHDSDDIIKKYGDKLKYEVLFDKLDDGSYLTTFNMSDSVYYERLSLGLKFLFSVVHTVLNITEEVVKENKIKQITFIGHKDKNEKGRVSIRTKLYRRVLLEKYSKTNLIYKGNVTIINYDEIFPELFKNESISEIKTNVDKLLLEYKVYDNYQFIGHNKVNKYVAYRFTVKLIDMIKNEIDPNRIIKFGKISKKIKDIDENDVIDYNVILEELSDVNGKNSVWALEFKTTISEYERTNINMTHLFSVIQTVILITEDAIKKFKIGHVIFAGYRDNNELNAFTSQRTKVYKWVISKKYPKSMYKFDGNQTMIYAYKIFPELFQNKPLLDIKKSDIINLINKNNL